MRALLVAGWLTAFAALPATAITGKVVDPEGNPIAGATACLIVDRVPGHCVLTDERGTFDLVDTDVPRMRVSADGFLSRYVPAVTHEEPIELLRGASIRVRLVDSSTGEAVDRGEIALTYPSGMRKGPFPANRAGLRVRDLPPGEIAVLAQAEGYRPPAGRAANLVAGEEADVTIEMEPVDSEGGSADEGP